MWFKKNKEKGEEEMTTLEQVRKAYEDLSEDDKKKFHQSLSDRVHESIAAQERADGDEDSQSAEDREHEALGAEHADGEGDVEELHETDPEDAEEEHEEEQDRKDDRQDERHEETEDWQTIAEERLKRLEEAVDTILSKKGVEEKAKDVYGLGTGIFPNSGERAEKKVTSAEVAKTIRKFM